MPVEITSESHKASSIASAEFLFQLMKMLQDENNKYIEWEDGEIKISSPTNLAKTLHNYFNHNKFSSFQRQLNYFRFYKRFGKGKMSPCAYRNDFTTKELHSILFLRRKPTVSRVRSRKKNVKKANFSRKKYNDKTRKIRKCQVQTMKNYAHSVNSDSSVNSGSYCLRETLPSKAIEQGGHEEVEQSSVNVHSDNIELHSGFAGSEDKHDEQKKSIVMEDAVRIALQYPSEFFDSRIPLLISDEMKAHRGDLCFCDEELLHLTMIC